MARSNDIATHEAGGINERLTHRSKLILIRGRDRIRIEFIARYNRRPFGTACGRMTTSETTSGCNRSPLSACLAGHIPFRLMLKAPPANYTS